MDKRASSKRYPDELKERAVRVVGELRHADPGEQGAISRVARQLGVAKESLRAWVKQADIDVGHQHGVTTGEHDEFFALPNEDNELRRANDIPQAVATFTGGVQLCGTGR